MLLQYALGVTTLLLVVPVPLATLHQAVAILLLTAALCRCICSAAKGRSRPAVAVLQLAADAPCLGRHDARQAQPSPLAATDSLFFGRRGATLDQDAASGSLPTRLSGMDDGELFLEYRESEQLSLDDGPHPQRAASIRIWGSGCARCWARRPAMRMPARSRRRRCAGPRRRVSAVRAGRTGQSAEPPRATNARLYSDANPLAGIATSPTRTAALAHIDAYARGRDPRVKQVMASLGGEWQAVQILRADGTRVADLRPLVRLSVSVVVEQDGRRESGSYGGGGRFGYETCWTRPICTRPWTRRCGRRC